MIIVTLILCSCVTPAPRIDINNPQEVASAISINHDNFKKLTNYKGPDASSNINDKLFIRARKNDSNDRVDYQIYVMDYYYGDWRFYNSAYDSNGNRLDTIIISRDVVSCDEYGCSHEEHMGLNVTRDYLENNQNAGIRFKISGKAGEEIFFIPAGYIKAFLSVVK